MRGWDVDVVVADGNVGDDLQSGRRVDQLAVDAIGEHADERVPVGDAPQQLVTRNGPVAGVNVQVVPCVKRSEY